MLGERLGRGKKQMSRPVKCCVTTVHTSCSHARTPLLRIRFEELSKKTHQILSPPMGLLPFSFLWSCETVGEDRETQLKILLTVQLCSLPTPQSHIQLQVFSQQRRVCELRPFATLTSRSDLWRSCFNMNNRSWGRVFKILWLNTLLQPLKKR